MKKYELLFVLPGTLDEREAEVKAQEMLALMSANSTEPALHFLGKNRLAYPIKQIRYGYFYTVVFSADPENLKILEEKLRLTREPLRTMISHFNTLLTAAQKIVYSTDEAGVTTMMEKGEVSAPSAPTMPSEPVTDKSVDLSAVPTVKSAVERKTDKLDLDAINKKLDDLMSGDVIPGV